MSAPLTLSPIKLHSPKTTTNQLKHTNKTNVPEDTIFWYPHREPLEVGTGWFAPNSCCTLHSPLVLSNFTISRCVDVSVKLWRSMSSTSTKCRTPRVSRSPILFLWFLVPWILTLCWEWQVKVYITYHTSTTRWDQSSSDGCRTRFRVRSLW